MPSGEGGWPINIVKAVNWENVRVSFVTKERNKPFLLVYWLAHLGTKFSSWAPWLLKA